MPKIITTPDGRTIIYPERGETICIPLISDVQGDTYWASIKEMGVGVISIHLYDKENTEMQKPSLAWVDIANLSAGPDRRINLACCNQIDVEKQSEECTIYEDIITR